jgi:hypothetical protein
VDQPLVGMVILILDRVVHLLEKEQGLVLVQAG